MWSEIVAIYRASKKKRDINRFTEYVARPPAAIFVLLFKATPITPNQVTFLSAIVAAASAAMFALLPGYFWLVMAALVFELSFVLDCVDGMLARLRKTASPVGHLLDFLMDELKAMFMYAAVAIRLWQETADVRLLLVGIGGLFCLAAGLSLTSFLRRPELGAAQPTEDGQPAEVGGRRGPIGMALTAFEWVSRIFVHYPQYIWITALVNRIDIYFWAYTAVNVLYLGKCLATILFRFGRFAPRVPAAEARLS
ncbi:MAG TPA: CDP-alcohol phosphatidyltransferase family protein [Kofleriaceae bacterium]|nr:CDP-alcohol phosphatidyltransferase family protein [Kofleriaceae bacterium]